MSPKTPEKAGVYFCPPLTVIYGRGERRRLRTGEPKMLKYNPAYRVRSLEFARGDKLQDVLKRLETFEAMISSFFAEGSGGGNPCLTLDFPSRERAIMFLSIHTPDVEAHEIEVVQ